MNGERIAFENWLGIKPCGAAHDLAWAAWQARASLPAPQQATPARPDFEAWWSSDGPNTASPYDAARSAWEAARQQATPEPVGEPAEWQARVNGNKHDDAWRKVTPTKAEPTVSQRVEYLRSVKRADGQPAYEFRALYTRPAATPAVPEDSAQEAMTSKWCWWFGDDERFQIVDTESEAHGEAQSYIDDDADSGEERSYSIARVQHPIDALGMDWLALHVAESIAENVCCWCDDNTGAEESSIMLSPDDSKVLGLMVATFLRQRVGVDWWTADQKTITQHTHVAGSNDAPAAAPQGADHG
ncbi:hypothetical protein [Aquabacterium sp.]|uniref:hypothetical protein n=1 Tax=Aquabacterium sp. TaxID=1872578 RepID=UPI0035C73D49